MSDIVWSNVLNEKICIETGFSVSGGKQIMIVTDEPQAAEEIMMILDHELENRGYLPEEEWEKEE